MSDIKLVYFEGCPEAKNIRAALLRAGINDFEVILQNELPREAILRKLSSPSVLKDNELIYGIRTSGEISSCTFDSVNFIDEERLVRRFKELRPSSVTNRSKASLVSMFFSVLFFLKCPACIPAVATFFASLGLSVLLSLAIQKSLLILILSMGMAGLILSYKQHRNFFPFLSGLCFSVMMFVARFHYITQKTNQILVYGSIAGLFITALWDYRLRNFKTGCDCSI